MAWRIIIREREETRRAPGVITGVINLSPGAEIRIPEAGARDPGIPQRKEQEESENRLTIFSFFLFAKRTWKDQAHWNKDLGKLHEYDTLQSTNNRYIPLLPL